MGRRNRAAWIQFLGGGNFDQCDRFEITENVENVMAYHSEGAPEERTVVPTTKARQGVTGNNVRYVLGFGLAAVVIAFAVIFFIYFG